MNRKNVQDGSKNARTVEPSRICSITASTGSRRNESTKVRGLSIDHVISRTWLRITSASPDHLPLLADLAEF
uniref:Uncharacterized protein n=1 Tax=Romanomermis culicivorax TaxID=13658 RepID=A0A915JJY5_ROMCU